MPYKMEGYDEMKYCQESTFTKTEEELEQQRKELLIEINKIDNELRRAKKKKVIIITSIILISFSLFKIFIGEINLNFANIVSQHKNRLYEVTINNTLIDIGIEETRRTTIIPFIIYTNDFSSHMYFGVKDGQNLKFVKGHVIILNINSYECYAKKIDIQLSCINDYGNYKKIKTNNTNYTLRIKKLNKKETITYNGKFINNISNYLPENGKYRIFITGKYKNITSIIYFDLEMIRYIAK